MQSKQGIFSTNLSEIKSTSTDEVKTVSANDKLEFVYNRAVGEKCSEEYAQCLKNNLFYQIKRSGDRSRYIIDDETSDRCSRKEEECFASHGLNRKN